MGGRTFLAGAIPVTAGLLRTLATPFHTPLPPREGAARSDGGGMLLLSTQVRVLVGWQSLSQRRGDPVDTFDTLTLGAFVLLLLPVTARLTIWKQNGQLLRVWPTLIPIVLSAIAALTLCTVHHWNAPQRRVYQYVLGVSSVLASLAILAVNPKKRDSDLSRPEKR